MGEFALGQSVPRSEDPRLLRGGGRYAGDRSMPGMVHGYVLRSPHAHARIVSIDVSTAAAAPGVVAVFTGADWEALGWGGVPGDPPRKRRDGTPGYIPPFPALVSDRVRYVGDCVAFVVAESRAQAQDAAELIDVAYQPLPAIVDTERAPSGAAPLVWDDCANNIAFVHQVGDRSAVDAAFEAAAHVVSRKFVINRDAPAAIEPRACLAHYDAMDDRYTIYTTLQHANPYRASIAGKVIGIPESKLRVVSGDVGGSYGMKSSIYNENILVLWASKATGRPVKWTSDRTEAFQSDTQGRDNVTTGELALDADGNFLGLRVKTIGNLGAYMTQAGGGPLTINLGTLAGVYTTPAIHVDVTAVYTNTTITRPYRGAGRPEAAFVIERLVDLAADALGLDPAELRRRNTIPPEAMPFQTGLTFKYDCGAFEENMDMALGMADYAGFGARRTTAAKAGKLRGIGISNTIERAGAPSMEEATVQIDRTGNVTVLVGTISQGQGHDTVYKQIVAQQLGLPVDRIRVREGDTDQQGIGGGTGGSRSATCGGSAVFRAAEAAVKKAKILAAHQLEASPEDIEFADGVFTIAGTDRRITLDAVAKASYAPGKQPEGVDAGIDERATYAPDTANYPNGCHACEVEIDRETGEIDIVAYVVVDDVGTVLNPLLLKGQIHGGVAQGYGQAVLERAVYDDSGQNVTASFMDYAMPRADDFGWFEVKSNPVPTKQNPLGVKGAGEAGTVGALPAVLNAIENALHGAGVERIEMPASPERVWAALRAAG